MSDKGHIRWAKVSTVASDGSRRYSADTEEWIDRSFKRESGLLMRVLLRVFGGSFNAFAKCLLGRAYERGIINSKAFHEMAAMSDRMLIGQEREPTGSWTDSL